MLDIKSLLGAMLAIVFGVVLFPTVKDEVDKINTTGVTGGSLIALLPMIYIIVIVSGAVAYVYWGAKK